MDAPLPVTSITPSDREWNKKLAELGYPPVPYAQGLYFIVISQRTPEKILAAVLAAGVIAHIEAVCRALPNGYAMLSDEEVMENACDSVEKFTPEVNKWLGAEYGRRDVKFESLSGYPAFQIAFLNPCDEQERIDFIQDDNETCLPHARSIVPVALHYKVWPRSSVYDRYYEDFFLAYPEFFLDDELVGWIDLNIQHNAEKYAKRLAAIFPRLKTLGWEQPERYGPAMLIAAKSVDHQAIVDWLDEHREWFFNTFPAASIPYYVWVCDTTVQRAVLRAARQVGLGGEMMFELLNAQLYDTERDSLTLAATDDSLLDMEDSILKPREQQHILNGMIDILQEGYDILRYTWHQDVIASKYHLGIPLEALNNPIGG